MFQFSIRSLFVVIFVAAVFLGIAQTAGYVAAAGLVVAVYVLVWAVVWRRPGEFIYLRIGSAVFALVAIWFLAVDWSWFVTDCPDCLYVRDVGHYRVLGIPVRTHGYEHLSLIQVILEDLGVPCEHANCERWHKYRFWGLVFLACPCIDGSRLICSPDGYTDAMAAKVRRLGAEDPELAAQLHDTAIRKHDYQSFWRTIEDLTGEVIGSGPSGADFEP